jgi:CheY-like chemotaxis protein
MEQEMNFQHIKQPLFDNCNKAFEIYNILKDATGAKNIDILYYDDSKSIFFDKTNKITIQMKFLNKKSFIGYSIIEKKPIFIKDIEKSNRYHSAIDNPFKIDLKNQGLIPIFNSKSNIIGVIRLSTLPTAFNQIDFKRLNLLTNIFIKIFESNDDTEEIHNEELMNKRLENYILIKELNKLYDKLSKNKTNPELQKLIDYGKENSTNIFTYLNPSISKSAKINKEKKKFKNKGYCNNNRINILIADDIRINVQILNAMLSNYNNIGCIKFAYDGLEAIDVINECNNCDELIHLIFLDHHMPGKSGSDIARELKSGKFENKDITIVSITNDMDILIQHKDLYDYHIPKPFTRNNVKNIMDKIYLIE